MSGGGNRGIPTVAMVRGVIRSGSVAHGGPVRSRVLIVAAILALACPWAVGAQEGLPSAEDANVFLERSYLSPFMPTGKNLILEGHASTHFWIRNELDDATWRRTGGWKWGNVPVSMIFVVRIFDDFSSPVRTPSFILRPLYHQVFHLKRWREPGAGHLRLWSIGVGATHHSDGQAGCTFLGQSYDPMADDCSVTDPALYAERRANVVDGSFSTNFFQLDVGWRRGWLNSNAYLDRQISVRGELEIHPRDFLIGGLSEELAAEYGQYMAGLAVEGEKAFASGIARVEVRQQWRFGGGKASADGAGRLEIVWLHRRAENFGWFARLHWGSDYYNIHFQNDEAFFQLGMTWDPGRLDQYVRGNAP